MSTPLRILLIEDSDDDATLLLRELRKGGYEPEWLRVDTAERLSAALRDHSWELITCDWVMPAFSALMALDLLRAHGCDLPVIIVSGEVGEEVAVSALKSGARDYVSKHRLTRLLPAVERELREQADQQARRRAEASLRHAQERLQLFVEWASDIIFSLDRAWRVTSVNPAVTAALGYEPAELVGRPALELIHPRSRDAVRRALTRVWSGEQAEVTEFEVVTRSGQRRFLEVSGRALHGEGARAESFHIGRDVTEQRRVERERARLSAALEQAPEPIAITDEHGRILYMNAAGERLSGLSRREVEGRAYEVVPADGDHPVPLERLLGPDGMWSGLVVQSLNGEPRRLEIAISPIRDGDGRIVSYVSRVRRVLGEVAQPAMQ